MMVILIIIFYFLTIVNIGNCKIFYYYYYYRIVIREQIRVRVIRLTYTTHACLPNYLFYYTILRFLILALNVYKIDSMYSCRSYMFVYFFIRHNYSYLFNEILLYTYTYNTRRRCFIYTYIIYNIYIVHVICDKMW